YYFRHDASGHTLVVADTPQEHADLPGGGSIQFGGSDDGLSGEGRIHSWVKTQEVRSGRVSLRDHCFQVPRQSLAADARMAGDVAVGRVCHPLRVANNECLEVDDFPGGFARWFDGVNPGGGDRSDDLDHLFVENKRSAELRMEEEAAGGLSVQGEG